MNFQKIISSFILLLFVLFGVSACAKEKNPMTFNEMIEFSADRLKKSDKHFDEVCLRITKNFSSDKAFIRLFNKDIANFKEYRKVQANMIFPVYEEHPTNYGVRFPLFYEGVLFSLNEQKLDTLKTSIKLYCLYNESYLPEGVCIDKKREQLFK